MDDRVYQILYCSRNSISGTAHQLDAEIASILKASRKNNARAGVSGALFYNTVFFAQVLEGRFSDVQGVFERLQLDARHSDLVVLQSGYVRARDFGDWSMAYAGSTPDLALPFAQAVGRELSASETSLNGQKVLDFLRSIVLKQDGAALPLRRPTHRPVTLVEQTLDA